MPSRTARKPFSEPPSIETLRARMDEINLKLLSLLSLRANVAVEIGRLKHHDGGVVYQPAREREVLEKMVAENPGPLEAEMVRRIFAEIVSACRALEQVPRIAFLGPEHTYSHDAAMVRFGGSVEFVPEPSFPAVFQAAETGRADFAVVPVENSTDGSITLTLDLLIDTPLTIIGEIKLPIRQALALRDGDRASIRKIVSHPSSLAQCRGYLAANFPNVEQEQVASNALATRRAAEEPGVAAIASVTAAKAYGLRVIAHNIQDVANNTTRFLVMGKQPVDRSGADKTTVIFAVADRVGTLHGALNVFARNGINISKIESRPLRARPWEYLFFVDFAGHRDDPKVKRGLLALGRKTLFLKVLGSYPEGKASGS